MKKGKVILKWTMLIFLIPIAYLIGAFALSWITIDRVEENSNAQKTIYLGTNGVHLDIVIPIHDIDSSLKNGLIHEEGTRYVSFGWGDERFYINTPTWGDLTVKNAINAMFLNSTTLMHVTRFEKKRDSWIEVKVGNNELRKLNEYLYRTFATDNNGFKILLENQGYSSRDDFYKAKGSYSCLKTCNSWVNSAFKESGLKSCLWTPFDFGLLNKYE